MTQVYLWLSDPLEDEAVGFLQDHGYPLLAKALLSVINAPDKQRGGIYGTAQQIASFLTNREAMRWVTPIDSSASPTGTGADRWVSAGARRQINADDFVQGTATLYSVSTGEGTDRALLSRAPAPGTIQQQTAAFTGTVSDESVRLLVGSGTQTNRVNERLDGDTLELTISQTRACSPGA